MYYKCKKCGHYTWSYEPKKHHQVVKNWKRWNRCPWDNCWAYNNSNDDQYLEENKDRSNWGPFQPEKWILKTPEKKFDK